MISNCKFNYMERRSIIAGNRQYLLRVKCNRKSIFSELITVIFYSFMLRIGLR